MYWFWVIIGVVVIGVIGAALGGNINSNTTSTQVVTTIAEETTAEETTAEETTAEPTTEEPTTEKPTEPPTEKPTEPSYYTIGQTYEDGDLDISFVSVETYTGYNEFAEPAEGNKVIRAYFEITNGGNYEIGVGSWDFECYADNETVEEYYCLEDNADELESYVNLSKGRSVKGYIYYEVPKDAKDIEIEYKPVDTGLFDDDDPIVFKVQ